MPDNITPSQALAAALRGDFRLPRLLLDQSRDCNRSTAKASQRNRSRQWCGVLAELIAARDYATARARLQDADRCGVVIPSRYRQAIGRNP